MSLSPVPFSGYGQKADIWSIGVLLWELVVPNPVANRFIGVPTVRYCRDLSAGVRLDVPSDTDAEYAALAKSCWEWLPSHRPTADVIADKLAVIIDRVKAELERG